MHVRSPATWYQHNFSRSSALMAFDCHHC